MVRSVGPGVLVVERGVTWAVAQAVSIMVLGKEGGSGAKTVLVLSSDEALDGLDWLGVGCSYSITNRPGVPDREAATGESAEVSVHHRALKIWCCTLTIRSSDARRGR